MNHATDNTSGSAHRVLWRLAPALYALLLVSAAPESQPLDLVRQGNAAFGAKDFAAALERYDQAAGRITDPGLVAFNEAAALYRLGRYREAELRYRRALEGADGPRRALALYGLGNALLLRSAGADVSALYLAVESYRLCQQESAAADLRDNLRHNLELACLLLARARAKHPEQPPPNQPEKNPTPGQNKGGPERQNGAGEPNDPDRGERIKNDQKTADGQERAVQSKESVPGKGNLPTLPDDGELVPLPPEDTLAYLRQIRERILRQRREEWQAAARVGKNVKDW